MGQMYQGFTIVNIEEGAAQPKKTIDRTVACVGIGGIIQLKDQSLLRITW